jgi:hypothetical protein
MSLLMLQHMPHLCFVWLVSGTSSWALKSDWVCQYECLNMISFLSCLIMTCPSSFFLDVLIMFFFCKCYPGGITSSCWRGVPICSPLKSCKTGSWLWPFGTWTSNNMFVTCGLHALPIVSWYNVLIICVLSWLPQCSPRCAKFDVVLFAWHEM